MHSSFENTIYIDQYSHFYENLNFLLFMGSYMTATFIYCSVTSLTINVYFCDYNYFSLHMSK